MLLLLRHDVALFWHHTMPVEWGIHAISSLVNVQRFVNTYCATHFVVNPMALTNLQIAEMALGEAERMAAALRSKDAPTQIYMPAAQFIALTNLISLLGQRLREPDPSSFEDTRYWVPLESYERTRRALQLAKAECVELRQEVDSTFRF